MRCLQREEVMGEHCFLNAHLLHDVLLKWLNSIDEYNLWCLNVLVFRQQDLFSVLKAYTLYRPEEGYCQAQAPVAAVLLMHMPVEVNIQNFSVKVVHLNKILLFTLIKASLHFLSPF